jgi:hypothetical protein
MTVTMAPNPVPTNNPPPDSKIVAAVRQLLDWAIEMRVPHLLIDTAVARNVGNSAFLVAFATVVFGAVRWFSASDGSLTNSVLFSVASYAILAIAAGVALRQRVKDEVFREWSQISSLLFFLFLLSGCFFALTSFLYAAVSHSTLVNDSPLDPIVTRLILSAVSAFTLIYLFSWRTQRIHEQIWSNIPSKRIWFGFYLVFVAISTTLIASTDGLFLSQN